MACLVLLRGVNVGGRTLSTTGLAKALADLDVTNIGAAGTFVVRGRGSAASVRRRFAEALPFETEVIVASAAAVRKLAGAARDAPPAGARRFFTALAKAPSRTPPLPLARPGRGAWEVRLDTYESPFVVSVRRNKEGKFYPNALVEAEYGVPATTRAWDILAKIEDALGA